MFYDAILSYLGEFGSYQKRKLLLVCLLCIPHGIQVCGVIFNLADSHFRCAVPGLDNDTYHIQNDGHGRLVNATVPFDADTGHFSECDVYDSFMNSSHFSLSEVNQNHTRSCHRWVFDPDIETATSTFGIVCHRVYLKAHFKMAVLMGLLAGSLCGGPLSDYFGRKKLLVVVPVLHAVTSISLAFVTSPIQYIIVKFLDIFVGMTSYLAAFVMVAEIVGPKKRTLAEVCSKYNWSIGLCLLVLVNYLVPNWRHAQLILSLPCLGFVCLWWFIDESPRWLIVKGRTDEAKNIMNVIAKVNKTKLPEDLELKSSLESKKVTDERIWHICASRVLVTRVIILCVGWATASMVYYGLTLNMGSLIEGSLYVNFMVQTILEAMSYVICNLILDKVGRKPIYCGSLLLAGCACLVMNGPILTKSNERWINVLLLGLGRFSITGTFTLVFIVTTELLPTSMRNSGLGFCSSVGRVAGLVSPYVASLGFLMSSQYGATFPLTVFGIAGIVAGLLGLLLPESRHKKLPETMEDAKRFGRTVHLKAMDETRT